MENSYHHALSEMRRAVLEADDTVLGSDKAIPLSKMDKELASYASADGRKDGDKDDDVINNTPDQPAVSELKPAQKEVIVGKAVAFALGYAFNDFKEANAAAGAPDLANMEAIVSSDDYIMDGHHRWAAATLLYPGAKVKVTRVDLPGEQLITALNAMTKGRLGIDVGNKGKGDIQEFTPEKVKEAIEIALNDGTKKGLGQKWPVLTPEQVQEALGKIPGAEGDAEKGKSIMADNAAKLIKQKMPGAPSRKDMPVIDAEKVTAVVDYLKKGVADLKPPHGDNVKNSLKETFQRRAGIKK